MTLTKRGFTIVELMVVVAVIAVLLATLSFSIAGARERARIQKAQAEVKSLTQAILGYENYAKGFELKAMRDVDATRDSLAFLFGSGASVNGNSLPVLFMASIQAGGKINDPWGTPYKVRITPNGNEVKLGTGLETMRTGYYLPNFYRLTKEERSE